MLQSAVANVHCSTPTTTILWPARTNHPSSAHSPPRPSRAGLWQDHQSQHVDSAHYKGSAPLVRLNVRLVPSPSPHRSTNRTLPPLPRVWQHRLSRIISLPTLNHTSSSGHGRPMLKTPTPSVASYSAICEMVEGICVAAFCCRHPITLHRRCAVGNTLRILMIAGMLYEDSHLHRAVQSRESSTRSSLSSTTVYDYTCRLTMRGPETTVGTNKLNTQWSTMISALRCRAMHKETSSQDELHAEQAVVYVA